MPLPKDVYKRQSLTYEPHPVEDKAAEKARLQAAISQFIQDTQAVADTFGKRLDARDAEILTGHIDMIQDPVSYTNLDVYKRQGWRCSSVVQKYRRRPGG